MLLFETPLHQVASLFSPYILLYGSINESSPCFDKFGVKEFHLRHYRSLFFRVLHGSSVSLVGSSSIAHFPSLLIRHQVRLVMAVSWHILAGASWKLNVDGSSLGNPGHIGGGIVIRDGQGTVHLAEEFGMGSSLMAESMALLRSLQLCIQHGFSNVAVETDSKVLFLLRTSQSSWP